MRVVNDPVGCAGSVAGVRVSHAEQTGRWLAAQIVAFLSSATDCILVQELDFSEEATAGEVEHPSTALIHPVFDAKVHFLRGVLVVGVEYEDAILVQWQ